ncbi:MAG: hypothetical protein LBC18_13635 [Opitutaceae bacterium]|jgi:hypothetical protein|nr:hypothetical protein [Opitutaceae bacterium]
MNFSPRAWRPFDTRGARFDFDASPQKWYLADGKPAPTTWMPSFTPNVITFGAMSHEGKEVFRMGTVTNGDAVRWEKHDPETGKPVPANKDEPGAYTVWDGHTPAQYGFLLTGVLPRMKYRFYWTEFALTGRVRATITYPPDDSGETTPPKEGTTDISCAVVSGDPNQGHVFYTEFAPERHYHYLFAKGPEIDPTQPFPSEETFSQYKDSLGLTLQPGNFGEYTSLSRYLKSVPTYSANDRLLFTTTYRPSPIGNCVLRSVGTLLSVTGSASLSPSTDDADYEDIPPSGGLFSQVEPANLLLPASFNAYNTAVSHLNATEV